MGETYALCDHELIELTGLGDVFATAICRRCSIRFRMCGAGCPNHPERGGAWHYEIAVDKVNR